MVFSIDNDMYLFGLRVDYNLVLSTLLISKVLLGPHLWYRIYGIFLSYSAHPRELFI